MDGKKLKVGMTVKNGSDTIVKVTSVPSLDKNDECFFSGTVIKSNEDYHKVGVNYENEFNSAFSYPI